jgi:ribonuclease Z
MPSHQRRTETRVDGAALLLVLALTTLGCERLLDRQIDRNLGRADRALLSSPEMTVVLCGTGSPLPDAKRAGACTAVIAGGQFVLVDVGPGAWKTADLANLPTADLSAVLLTHFHSDHIGDLGETVTQSWIAGRARPLEVFGPPGTARVVEGFRRAYEQDAEYRVAHHGETYLPRAAADATAREIELGPEANASAIVFERNGLRVTMFRVDHAPVHPAVGYRFDYRGRSVVVSGDTRKSDSLIQHATDADLLVHEALERRMIERGASVAERGGRTRLAKLARDIPAYHTSPVEVAEVAHAAHVKHVILTHLVPAPTNFITQWWFTRGMADVYSGEITVGADGMRFALAPAP